MIASDTSASAAPPATVTEDQILAGADMSRLRDASLRRAYDWWRSLPRQTAAHGPGLNLPDRTEIDPCAIPDLLPHVVLWAVLRQPDGSLRYRCRLAGTGMVEVHGHEFTGQWMEDFHGARMRAFSRNTISSRAAAGRIMSSARCSG